jgi:hypothetical protein
MSLLFGIIRHFFAFGRDWLPRSVFFEDSVDSVAEFSGDGSDSSKMVLPPGSHSLVILREDRVTKSRPGGGQSDGPPEIR